MKQFIIAAVICIAITSCKKDVVTEVVDTETTEVISYEALQDLEQILRYPNGLPWNQLAPTVTILNKPSTDLNVFANVPSTYEILTSCSDADRVVSYRLFINNIFVDSVISNNVRFSSRAFSLAAYPAGEYTVNVSARDQRGNLGGDAMRINKLP